MDTRQRRMLERFNAVLLFLDNNWKKMQNPPPMLEGRKRSLQQTVARLNDLADRQNFLATPGDTVAMRRDKLRSKLMLPLRDIAEPVLRFAPGAAEALRVPHAHASARVVAAAALRMADALEKHGSLLRSAGISKDDLRAMRQEARGLALAVKTNAVTRQRRADVTRGVATEIKKGLLTVQSINGLVMLRYRGLEELWSIANRNHPPVGRPPRKRPHRRRQLPS